MISALARSIRRSICDPLFVFASVFLLIVDLGQACSWIFLDPNWYWVDIVSGAVIFVQIFLVIFQASAYDGFYRHNISIELDRHRVVHTRVSNDILASDEPFWFDALGGKPLNSDLSHTPQFVGVSVLFPFAHKFLHASNMGYRLFLLIKTLYVSIALWVEFIPGTWDARLIYMIVYQFDVLLFHLIFWFLPFVIFAHPASIVYKTRG